jgi:hypothetical protein
MVDVHLMKFFGCLFVCVDAHVPLLTSGKKKIFLGTSFFLFGPGWTRAPNRHTTQMFDLSTLIGSFVSCT